MYSEDIKDNNKNSELKNSLKTSIPEKKAINRVDINVLKSKLQDAENKQFVKNMLVIFLFLLLLASLGIYMSI